MPSKLTSDSDVVPYVAISHFWGQMDLEIPDRNSFTALSDDEVAKSCSILMPNLAKLQLDSGLTPFVCLLRSRCETKQLP